VKRLLLVYTLLFFSIAFGSDDLVEFSDPLLRERYDQLTWELRCPKCQNQNLADSNSPISLDLKDEIHHLLERGLSNQEIKAHLTSRYSDFILYRPQVNKTTSLLWGSPILILFIGGWLVFRLSRRSNELKQENLKSEMDKRRLKNLLDSGTIE
jgi:cytochrome c-type biogenesis protein CcmH